MQAARLLYGQDCVIPRNSWACVGNNGPRILAKRYTPRGNASGGVKKYWRVKSVRGWDRSRFSANGRKDAPVLRSPNLQRSAAIGRFPPSTSSLYEKSGENATYSLKFALYSQDSRK